MKEARQILYMLFVDIYNMLQR